MPFLRQPNTENIVFFPVMADSRVSKNVTGTLYILINHSNVSNHFAAKCFLQTQTAQRIPNSVAHFPFGFGCRSSFWKWWRDINGIANAPNGDKIKMDKTMAFHLVEWHADWKELIEWYLWCDSAMKSSNINISILDFVKCHPILLAHIAFHSMHAIC